MHTTFVWTIPGDTHITLMPDSAGNRLCRTLLNITCTWNTEESAFRKTNCKARNYYIRLQSDHHNQSKKAGMPTLEI